MKNASGASLLSVLVVMLTTSYVVRCTTLPSFPAGSPWTTDVSDSEVASDSDATMAWLNAAGGFGLGRLQIDFSINVVYADCDSPRVDYATDTHDWGCDEPTDIPLPSGGAIEGVSDYFCDASSNDCHLLVYDTDTGVLYEAWEATMEEDGKMHAACLVMWDTNQVYPASGRGEQCTSADAAGFPISTLLFTADEIYAGSINHAIRFILPNSRMRDNYYVHPASHAGGPTAASPAPIYGTQLRLKRSYDISGLTAPAQIIAKALKKYGMFLADGGNIALTAQSDLLTDHTWDEVGVDSHSLTSINVTQFEVVAYDTPVYTTYDCVLNDILMTYDCESLPSTSTSTTKSTSHSGHGTGSSTSSSLNYGFASFLTSLFLLGILCLLLN